jgi:EAL domain-containing protein (putative c-di-GMP-specific phosphodiesterase class I)
VVESRSLVDLPGVVDTLAAIRHIGVRVALDDFGTGFSTLSWLQRLPVDRIKVDRSFIAQLPADHASAALLRGVVALGIELGVEVVAEGVETAEQLEMVRTAGCHLVQGFLLGRPERSEDWERRPAIPTRPGTAG